MVLAEGDLGVDRDLIFGQDGFQIIDFLVNQIGVVLATFCIFENVDSLFVLIELLFEAEFFLNKLDSPLGLEVHLIQWKQQLNLVLVIKEVELWLLEFL